MLLITSDVREQIVSQRRSTTFSREAKISFLKPLFRSYFAALLYYAHLLSDYLADDPAETEPNVAGRMVSGYAGQPYITINGNRPSFTSSQNGSDSPAETTMACSTSVCPKASLMIRYVPSKRIATLLWVSFR